MASRTPPEIKWLLVERATLAGDIEQLARRRALLDAEMEALRSRAQALDTSIRLLDARVNAAAAGQVFRHCQQYGERGALKAFIVRAICESKSGLSGRAIARLAAAHFGIEFLTNGELARYCANTIRPQLRQLREEGMVKTIPGAWPEGLLWCQKERHPTFADLAHLASLPIWEGPESAQNETRHQVAHQRDRDAAG
ncbi:MAG: hypothetical protein WCC39_14300 [Telluria sp.]